MSNHEHNRGIFCPSSILTEQPQNSPNLECSDDNKSGRRKSSRFQKTISTQGILKENLETLEPLKSNLNLPQESGHHGNTPTIKKSSKWSDDKFHRKEAKQLEELQFDSRKRKSDTPRRSIRVSMKPKVSYYEGDELSYQRLPLPLSGSDVTKTQSRHSLPVKHIDTPRPKRVKSTVVPVSAESPSSRAIGQTRSMTKRCTTPSMPGRTNALKISECSLEKARANLHVSAVPTALPCREIEFSNIYHFLEDKIYDASGGCMYISGVPGTGKTATVHAVIQSLQEKMESNEIPVFQFVEVNGLRLTEPRQVFVQLLHQLTGKKCAPQQARDILSKRFNSNHKTNKTVVLLVDEVDMLLNSRQDVVYTLFEWPNHAYSQLVVLTIANTMDLPERLFMGRVTSRLGLTRLTFPAYSYKQLQEIVMSRLDGTSSFSADAVQLVARKVAAISGDARRALDICRRATELVGDDDNITMKTIELAFDQMLNSPNVKAIKACSKMEKLFLKAVVMEKDRTGIEETSYMSVYRQFKSLCILDCGITPLITEAMAVLWRLGSSRLLLTEHSRSDLFQTIYLNISTDDLHYALSSNVPAVEPAQ